MSTGASPDSCTTKRHGCGLPSLSTCCCAGPALPDGTVPPPNAAASLTPVQTMTPHLASIVTSESPLELRLAAAPIHGFSTTDIPILLSTFLI